MIKTEAGEKMKEKNPNKELPEKADINKDGEFQEWEKARHEAIQAARSEDASEMAMGGLMKEGMGVIVGIEADSGNNIPAGSLPEEVADDIPAMLSEGEYVVPADVVRWHGVKTFEELRCEAKMGMGLMAHDGRIAEVDEETKKPVDYEIEEKDKPKVEKQESEVVEAAEGADISTVPRYQINPRTGRYELTTGEQTGIMQPVTPEPTGSRFDPQRVLEEIYGSTEVQETPEEEEEEEDQCPVGYVKDPDTGVCVPQITEGSDDTPAQTRGPDYASQPLTKLAEVMGPLSAEDLADYEGTTLADKAVSRMTTPAKPMQFSLNPYALVGSAVSNISDDVGARRAAETRAAEFTKDPTAYGAYNFNFNPATGSFVATKPSTRLARDEFGNLSNYNNIGRTGTEYTREQVFNSDIDDPNSAISDVFNGIEDEFKSMTAVSGGGSKNMYGSDEGLASTSDLSGSRGFSGSRGVDENRGPRGERSGASSTTSSQSESTSSSSNDTDQGSDEDVSGPEQNLYQKGITG